MRLSPEIELVGGAEAVQKAKGRTEARREPGQAEVLSGSKSTARAQGVRLEPGRSSRLRVTEPGRVGRLNKTHCAM